MRAVIDHIVISAQTLDDGAAWVEARLGVPLAPGGAHPGMGTHNRLLSLGPDTYLEVIAPDPDAQTPETRRMFDLDSFTGHPRLTNWVARSKSISVSLPVAPEGTGEIRPLSRGDNRWLMAIPASGQYPYGGLAPGLIEWLTPPPAPRLPDHGLRLDRLELTHPEAENLRNALAPLIEDTRIAIRSGPPGLAAHIATATGAVVLT